MIETDIFFILGVPIINHKDLMHKALNVPPTPSPDSAIHSAYSVFSSPNQSPLTQRHITLTPSLSRNNSDASHSSCCSYSSVSVSVSPTQQFSPTHSPIQVSQRTYTFNSFYPTILTVWPWNYSKQYIHVQEKKKFTTVEDAKMHV